MEVMTITTDFLSFTLLFMLFSPQRKTFCRMTQYPVHPDRQDPARAFSPPSFQPAFKQPKDSCILPQKSHPGPDGFYYDAVYRIFLSGMHKYAQPGCSLF
jgi:hypothetical protein